MSKTKKSQRNQNKNLLRTDMQPGAGKEIPTTKMPKHDLPENIIKKDLAKTLLFAIFSTGIILVFKRLAITL